MASRALAVISAFCLVLASPGTAGFLLFAGESESIRTYTDENGKPRAYAARDPQNPDAEVAALIAKLRSDPRLARQVPKEQVEQAVRLLQRYGDDPESKQALERLTKDLADQDKDPNLSLAGLFDRMSEFARGQDAAGTYVDLVSQKGSSQVMAVRSNATGQTLYTQESKEIGYKTSLKTIRKTDPGRPDREVVDAVILELEKGAASEQRVVYNRKVHELFKSLRTQYYDQADLSRQINNKDDQKITEKAREKMRQVRAKNQSKFPPELLEYLAKLDEHRETGALDQLDWKEADKMQRVAQRFSNGRQLEMMQKTVIAQLSSYFSQVTNSSPKEKKGEEALDASQKDIKDLQETLSEFEKGHLESFGLLMTKLFKHTKLNHEDQKYVTPELMNAAAEAFAYVAAAQKAQERAMNTKLSNEEIDAAVDESQKWLQLAQIELQSFEMGSLAIQMERLKAGELRDHLGLDDPKMKAQAMRLSKTAREQYLKKLEEAGREMKESLLKQSLAAFYLTYQNAANAELFTDTLQERVRTLAAKAAQIKSLYLALRFDKYKERYKGRSAMEKAQGKVYQYFLTHLPEKEAGIARQLEGFSKSLAELARLESAEAIREGLAPKEDEFREIAAKLGFDDIPDLDAVNKEASRLAIKQSQIFGAVQNFSAQLRVFDMMNELDLYLRKYASSEMVASESDGFWSQLVSFKWMDAVSNLGGGRDASAAGLMKRNPLTKDFFKKFRFGALGVPQTVVDTVVTGRAFEKLGDEKQRKTRKEALSLLAGGRFNEALAKIEKLDPDAAKKALKDYEAAKTPDDPFDFLDFDAFMSKTADDKALIKAQGVMGSLFDELQPYIMGYTITSALYDIGVWTVATAGLGALWETYLTTGKVVQAGVKGIELARLAEEVEALQKMSRMRQILYAQLHWASTLAGKVPLVSNLADYMGGVLMHWGNGFKQVLDIKEVATWGRVPKQMLASVANSAHFTWDNIKGMSLASGGMQSVAHAWNPETSQYKDAGDAFWQGMVGGLAFGAKAGPMVLFSPMPASALGSKFMEELALSPGPVSSSISGLAKIFRPQSSVAKLGVMGAVETAVEGTAWKSLVGVGTWGWGMADGAAKYWLAAEVPKDVAEVAHFGYQQAFGDNSSKSHNGATARVHNLTEANSFGTGLSQISWLLLPVNGMYSFSEMRQYREAATSVSRLVRQNRDPELLVAAKGDKLGVDLTRMDRLSNWSLPKPKKGEIIMSEHIMEGALRRDAAKKSIGELAAASLPDLEAHGGRQSLAHLEAVLAGGKPPEAAAPKSPKLILEAARHRARGAKPEAEAERLYAVFSKDGKLVEVAPGKAKPAGDVVLSIKANGDGTFSVGDKKAAKMFGKGGYKRAQEALKEVSGALEKPEPLKKGEVFRTQEAVAVYKDVLGEKLSSDKAARKKVIDAAEAKQGHVELDGIEFSGDFFKKISEIAWQAQQNAPEYTIRAAAKSVAAVFGEKPELKIWKTVARGRLWKVLTGRPVEDKAGMRRTEIVRGMEDLLAKKGKASDAQRLESLREWSKELENTAKGPDAAALKPFLDKLTRQSPPEQVIPAAQAELAKLLEATPGAPDKTLTNWDKTLQGMGKAEDVPEVKAVIAKLETLKAEKGRSLEDAGKLQKAIDHLKGEGPEWKDKENVSAREYIWAALGEVEGMLGETAGAPADILQGWKARLGAKSADDLRQIVQVTWQTIEAVRAGGGSKAKELEPLAGILKGRGGLKGGVRETATAARAEIDRLLDQTAGASAKDLREVSAGLNRAADFEAKQNVKSVLAQAQARQSAAKGREAEALDPLIKSLTKKATPEQAVAASLDLARSLKRSDREGSNKEIGRLIEILQKEAPAAEVGREALEFARRLAKKSSGSDASSLERLADLLRGELRPQELAKLAREDIKRMRENTPGASRGTLESFQAGLDGKLTADDLTVSARGIVDGMIERSSPDTAAALRGLRRSIESDALIQYANENLVQNIKAYRTGGKLESYEQSKDLLIRTWERGVFGQMFKQRVETKTGEKVWDIPEEFGIKDGQGKLVKSFREGQLNALKGVFDLIAGRSLGERAEAKKQIYALLETSGGKTLLGFVLISFMESYARDQGKQGAYYVTANADLVNQTLDVYSAFFKGRKPSFKVITYSDLMVEQAQSQSTGALSPFQTHEVYLDEFDTVGLGTPLSLGKFNGAFSFSEIDPMQRVLRGFVAETGLLKRGETQLPGGVKTLYERFGGKNLSREEFKQMLEKTPGFKEAYGELRERAVDAVKQALKEVKSGKFMDLITEEYAQEMGMTRAQLYERLLREHKNAFGTFFELGVIEAKYGGAKGVDGWVDKVLEGAYEAASEGAALDTVYQRDPKRRQIIQFHNDQALDSLDTHYRTALELREGVPITLDFSHVAVTDFRKLVQAATDADALSIAASGTLPDLMRQFFKEEMSWGFVGEGSNPAKVLNLDTKIFSRAKGESSISYAADKIVEAIHSGEKNIPWAWVPSNARKDVLLTALQQRGVVVKEQVSEFTKPGYAYFTKDRYMFELETARNIEGFKTGKVKVVILVGQGGLRGLEAPLSKEFYGGGKIPMYVIDSHTLADVSLLQLLGRIDLGRIPEGSITSFHLLDEAETMLGSKTYAVEMRRKIIDAAQGLDAVRFSEAARILRSDPDMPRGRPMTDEAIFELFKKPALHRAKDLYRDYMTLHRLREVVGDAQLQKAMKDPKVMQEVLARPEVLQIMAPEMRRLAEEKALQSSGLVKPRQMQQQKVVNPGAGALPRQTAPDLEPAGK